jgi:hypothetical protein
MDSDLFPGTKPPRAVPRKLMHVCDASTDDYDDGLATVRMSCTRCDHVSDWLAISVTEAKRGLPCPNCNKETS